MFPLFTSRLRAEIELGNLVPLAPHSVTELTSRLARSVTMNVSDP